MKSISKKKHLEILLEKVPSHPVPKVEFEQYSTPSNIASDVLWNALNFGDIYNKSVMDLGCGTGIFTIGSRLLESKKSFGIDIDESAISKAIECKNNFHLENIDFFVNDLNDLSNYINDLDELFKKYPYLKDIDTVIQNPPFGSQLKSKKGADRIFIELAMTISPVVYSFHMKNTENFVINLFNKFGGELTHKFSYKFTIPKIYEFHTSEISTTEVTVFRFQSF
ncbi:MAG: METTL5 family protein [Methanobrevibacter sp.]|jgi:putative methylase|nr:METTL5 family protein [Candidatus Methanoflexus mossambicus]